MRAWVLALAVAGAVTGGGIGLQPAKADVAAAGEVAQAADPSGARAVLDLLQMDVLFEVMAQEGASYAVSLEEGMFPGRGGARWAARVQELYGDPAVSQRFAAAFQAALVPQPQVIARSADFFGSDLGRRITAAEIAARRVLLDPAATEAAEVAAEKLQAERAPRLRLIRRLIEAAQLIDSNLAGTMTGMLAFDLGLAETAPWGQSQAEAERQADLWADEGQIRYDTTQWLVSYMVLAYADLSDEQVTAYADFLATDAGHALTAALFAGFDAAMTPLMLELGREAGLVMQGHDI